MESPYEVVAVEDNFAPKDNVFRVEWNLGRRCNYDCSYCSPNIHDKVSSHISMEVVEKTVKRLVDHAGKENKKIRISLTGGEPFVHPNIFKILALMKEAGVHRISLTSNGSLPAKTYIKAMHFVDYLILSCHFEFLKMDPLKEMLSQVWKEVECLREREGKHKNMHVHLMALPSKFDELKELMTFCKASEIPHAIRRIRPQADKNGNIMRPFRLGRDGGGVLSSDNGKHDEPYYSKEELSFLGVR